MKNPLAACAARSLPRAGLQRADRRLDVRAIGVVGPGPQVLAVEVDGVGEVLGALARDREVVDDLGERREAVGRGERGERGAAGTSPRPARRSAAPRR
jgi:hypothetical protein